MKTFLSFILAVAVSTGVFGSDAQFQDGASDAPLRSRVERAAGEALQLAGLSYTPLTQLATERQA